jgi:hypothetical protein
VICNRPLDKAEFFIGGYPVGSTCAKNRGLGNSHSKKIEVVRNDQPDLFGDENDKEESSNSSASEGNPR